MMNLYMIEPSAFSKVLLHFSGKRKKLTGFFARIEKDKGSSNTSRRARHEKVKLSKVNFRNFNSAICEVKSNLNSF